MIFLRPSIHCTDNMSSNSSNLTNLSTLKRGTSITVVTSLEISQTMISILYIHTNLDYQSLQDNKQMERAI